MHVVSVTSVRLGLKGGEVARELYKAPGRVERFIGRIKQCRRAATRHEKTTRNYLAMPHLVSAMVRLL